MNYLKTSLICIIVLFISIYLGCSKKEDVGKSQNHLEKTKVVFLTYFTEALVGGSEKLTNTFNENSNEFELVSIPLDHEAFKTSITESLTAGDPPDIYTYWAGARTKAIINKLEPLNDVWESEGLDKVFPENISEAACTYNGKKYLIPLTQHYVAVFYNKAVFRKLGLATPVTWSEFLEVCEKIKKAGIVPIALGAKTKWPAQFWFDYILLRTAPYEYREQLMRGNGHYTDKEVENTFKIWKELIDKGYFNTKPNTIEWDTGADEMVYRGEAAMTLMGTWIIGHYSDDKYKWEQEKDYDFFSFPIIDEKIPKVALGPIDGVIVPKEAVNIEGAKKSVAFMAQIESQKVIVKGWGNISPNIKVEKDFYTPMQQRIIDDMSKADKWAFNYDLSAEPDVAEIGLNMFTQFLEIPEKYGIILERTEEKIQALKK